MNIPPPKPRAIPPPRTQGPPPRTQGPPPPVALPRGHFVKVVPDPNGGYKIVSSYLEVIVGSRFDRGKSLAYPEGRSSQLTLEQAKEMFAKWENFCTVNAPKQ